MRDVVTDHPAPFRPRRGRPDAKQVASIERAILATATRMFLEDGYDGVTMDRVVAAAGISKGTLYSRYSSKLVLFEGIVRSSVARWSDEAAVEDDQLGDDIADRLRHHARIIARFMVNPEVRAFQRLLLSNRARFPELSRAMHEAGHRFIVDLIARDMRAAAARDGIAVQDPDTTAGLFVSAITGWQLEQSAIGEPDAATMEAIALRYADLFLAARTHW